MLVTKHRVSFCHIEQFTCIYYATECKLRLTKPREPHHRSRVLGVLFQNVYGGLGDGQLFNVWYIERPVTIGQ